MRQYYFHAKTELKSAINFESLGITLRKFNNEETNTLLDNFDKIFLSRKSKKFLQEYIKQQNGEYENEDAEHEFLKKITSLPKNQQYAIFSLEKMFRSGIIVNKRYLRSKISKMIIIEVDEKLFCEYFEKEYIPLLIVKILNFTNYLDENTLSFQYENMGIGKIEDLESTEDLSNYFVIIEDIKICNSFNSTIMERLSVFLNSKDGQYNFNFISLIDILINDKGLLENQFLNKVSALEKILISDKDDKEKGFVLKVGFLCKNSPVDLSNDILSKRLHAIYKARSYIVHGDDHKLLDSVNYYEEIFNHKIEREKVKNRYMIRFYVIIRMDLELYFIIKEILKIYMSNPELIEFIKNN